MEFQQQHPELGRYLEDTELIDWQSPSVVACATELVEGRTGLDPQVRALFEWVRDEIDHSLDSGGEVLTCRASEVLREGAGLCFAKSHLLVALLRARGIPAGFGYQRLRRDAPEDGHVLHGFAAVYLHERSQFAALDPRGNRPGLETRFDLDRPSLAFDPDIEAGEETDPRIFPRPHRGVVEVLTRAPDLRRALAALPDQV